MVLLDASMETQHVEMVEVYRNADTSIRTELLRELSRTVEREVQRRNAAHDAGPENASQSIQVVSTGSGQNVSKPIISFPAIPRRVALGPSLHALQEWEGHVLEIRLTDFLARLVDLIASASHAGEEAVIPRAELSDEDNARMRKGSIFRWVIGYERSPAGTKKRVSQIVFRDLPVVTRSDLAHSEAWAQDMARSDRSIRDKYGIASEKRRV